MPTQLACDQRYTNPMRFQERDATIIETIYAYGGVLARRHLKDKFWPKSSNRAVLKRLSKLVRNGYLARPTLQQRKTQPLPEPVYWLGWRGALWLAGKYNLTVKLPTNDGETQQRKLAKQLRQQGIHWLREPRWIQLIHDLTVVDFRINVERATRQIPTLELEVWKNESEFRCDGDVIKYRYKDRRGHIRKEKKAIYPDGYLVIANHWFPDANTFTRSRLLLELDHATHSNERFGREKVAPGLAYIKSGAYKARFGDNSGRWLVVTTGEVRMKNLMYQTQKIAASKSGTFFFTTFEQIDATNILTQPVWWQVGRKEPVALFEAKG